MATKIKTLTDIRNGNDATRYCATHPNLTSIRRIGGNTTVKGTRPGSVTFRDTPTDLPRPARSLLVKMLIAIGLGIMVLLCPATMILNHMI